MRRLPHLLSGLSAVALLTASALPALAEVPAPAAATDRTGTDQTDGTSLS